MGGLMTKGRMLALLFCRMGRCSEDRLMLVANSVHWTRFLWPPMTSEYFDQAKMASFLISRYDMLNCLASGQLESWVACRLVLLDVLGLVDLWFKCLLVSGSKDWSWSILIGWSTRTSTGLLEHAFGMLMSNVLKWTLLHTRLGTLDLEPRCSQSHQHWLQERLCWR